MSTSGAGQKRVTKKGKYNQSPDWNQGKGSRSNWIVYSGRDSSNRYDIFKVDAKSGKTVRVTQTPGRKLDPSWSPDGRMIAYSDSDGVYITNDEGDNPIKVIKGGRTPDWGPRSGQ